MNEQSQLGRLVRAVYCKAEVSDPCNCVIKITKMNSFSQWFPVPVGCQN